VDLARVAERVWYGADAGAAVARAALLPLEALFRLGASARGALYDRGLVRAQPTALPAVSVGNLTVGGTGKTPVAAALARRLRDAGARPALVLRGVGGDEPRVHALLNPDVPVVVAADRVAGTREAAAAGADVAVLDDAFQHRRAGRVLDLVLVAAERAGARARLLPAGPYREPPAALRRAHLVAVTRKAASRDAAEARLAELARAAPAVPQLLLHLRPDALHAWPGDGGDAAGVPALGALAGARVLAVSGIGDPRAFEAQLREAGADVRAAAFPDHHAYDARDTARLARHAGDVDFVVCTLKDAVKLGPLWPRGAPALWYVSQRVIVEQGERVLADALDRLLAARATGAARPPGAPGAGPSAAG
jgi:tetraacyldisaccharide 4'-kinase